MRPGKDHGCDDLFPGGCPAGHRLKRQSASKAGRETREHWDGRYWPGYGQEVTAKDALELAAALKRAWPVKSANGRPQ